MYPDAPYGLSMEKIDRSLSAVAHCRVLSSRFRIVSSHQFGMTKQTTRCLECPAYLLGPERRSTPVQCLASGRPILSSQDADLQPWTTSLRVSGAFRGLARRIRELREDLLDSTSGRRVTAGS
ncbi:hypothetical protein ONE63_006536 [Megalurothrips usitatus]|uniref:Uncharacterized protein n=1 Tax=Megalurothrips usitatus TaxID=439358 RepID=A0AAV7XUP9_9NEOP|nr:hypothetical protein ONE63_006536 [Megalurothrips usitatus]